VGRVGQLSPKPFIVGFAAETEDVIEQAKAKCQRKKMDMIIANRVGSEIGMGSDENEVTVICSESITPFPTMPKRKLARQLIPLIAKEYKLRKQS
jgi:phosphopantothenoylcysteine decarboxylase/phosphopantothenate--cysteine ligase